METSVITTTLIGAISATIGIVATQILPLIRDNQQRKHEKNIYLRQKYEEMTQLILENGNFYNDILAQIHLTQSKLQSSDKGYIAILQIHPHQLTRAYAISTLYFPETASAYKHYLDSCALLKYSVIEFFRFTQEEQDITNNSQYQSATNNIEKAKNTLLQTIEQYAAKYTATKTK